MSHGVILSVDMSDPTSGAGINAAIKTAQGLDAYAQTVVSCVSIQTTEQMLGIWPVPAAAVIDQLRAAMTSFPVNCLLLGLLPNKDIIDGIGDFLDNAKPKIPVIVDPFICSRDGKRFLDQKVDVDAFKRRILIHADLLMPNVTEAENLTGMTIKTPEDMAHAAEMLLTLGARNVFLKGTGSSPNHFYEIYVDDRRTEIFEGERATDAPAHGAGSTLAAAVATFVAQGSTPREAVKRAREYLAQAIQTAPDLGKPIRPLNHLAR